MFDVTQELTTKTRRKSNTRSMNEDEHKLKLKLIQNHQILINRINTPDVQDLLHFIAGLQD